nr:hypothetical protein [Oceanococcus sp. HetDA_MAG_MS8]
MMEPPPLTTPIWVDALNLGYWCGPPPSLRVPLTALQGLLEQGRRAILVFDASAVHQFLEAERGLYAELLQASDCCLQVPSGTSADIFLLEAAKADGGVVISRDRFREHRRRFRSIVHAAQRRMDGFVAEDHLHIERLQLRQPLPPSAAQAWEQLQACCSNPKP